MDKNKKHNNEKTEPAQLRCPKCGHTEIVYLPIESMPLCPNEKCKGVRMIVEELLDEGKSY